MSLGNLLIISSLVVCVLSVLFLQKEQNLMKKLHLFSVASNWGIVFLFLGISILTGKTYVFLIGVLILFFTTPLIGSIVGKAYFKDEILVEIQSDVRREEK